MESRWPVVVIAAAVGIVVLVLAMFALRSSELEEEPAPRRVARAARVARPTPVQARDPWTGAVRERPEVPADLGSARRVEPIEPVVEHAEIDVPASEPVVITPAAEQPAEPVRLKTVGAVAPDLLATAESWLGEAVRAFNTGDIDRILELADLPADLRPGLSKWFEDRPNFRLEVREPEIFSLGNGRVRLRYERTDFWFDPKTGENRSETAVAEQVYQIVDGRMRLDRPNP